MYSHIVLDGKKTNKSDETGDELVHEVESMVSRWAYDVVQEQENLLKHCVWQDKLNTDEKNKKNSEQTTIWTSEFE